jgi:hypothetical protein
MAISNSWRHQRQAVAALSAARKRKAAIKRWHRWHQYQQQWHQRKQHIGSGAAWRK